jgi:hypothetical protein
MRKHRLNGVVLAVLLGLGVATQRPGTLHPVIGTARADVPFTAAALSVAGSDAAATHADPTTASRAPSLAVDAYLRGRALEHTTVVTYLSSVAHEHAVLTGYLRALAPARPTPRPAPPRPAVAAAPAADLWARLRQCESGGRYAEDTGNGYYGAYQFSAATWASLGLRGLPSAAPPAEQDRAAQALEARRGWSQWPACARALGLT